MNQNIQSIRDDIISAALDDIPFEGQWNWKAIERAAENISYSTHIARSVFPEKTTSTLIHFADMADRAMIKNAQNLDLETMRIRDRILEITLLRFTHLNTHKEAERLALQKWLLKAKKLKSLNIMWSTCDRIWQCAGDISTDYNHYTKRGLLAGVLTSTTFVWLNDTSSDMIETRQFMERRIDNVLKIGQTTGPHIDRFMKAIKR